MPKIPLPLDNMVDFLAEEDKYWQRLVADPRLWGEKKTQHDSAQRRHNEKRQWLSYYYDRTKDTDHKSQSQGVYSSIATKNSILRYMAGNVSTSLFVLWFVV